MAWRSERYCFKHYIRDEGAANITGANAFSTTQPKEHLIDNRAGSLCTFAATASDHYIQWDVSSSALANRLWIPAGHNMAGWDIRVRTADDAAITTNVVTIIDPAVAYTEGGAGGQSVPAGALDFTFSNNGDDYVRIDWPNETTINPALGEILYTRTRTLTTGIEPGWRNEVVPNVELNTLRGGGQPVLVEGANQKALEFRYRAVTDATDLTILNAVIALNASAPILVDPPFDTESAVWSILQRHRTVQDPQVPATTDAPQTQFDLEFLEHVL